jgi:hypothetical protein
LEALDCACLEEASRAMKRYPPGLGTTYDEHVKSWVVLRIGTGYIVEPRSLGESGSWTHSQAVLRMRGIQSS